MSEYFTMSDNAKRIIDVLCMRRSGASEITKALQILGVELGENLMSRAPGNNGKEFWEDLDVNALNIELLHYKKIHFYVYS